MAAARSLRPEKSTVANPPEPKPGSSVPEPSNLATAKSAGVFVGESVDPATSRSPSGSASSALPVSML